MYKCIFELEMVEELKMNLVVKGRQTEIDETVSLILRYVNIWQLVGS